MTVSTDWSLHEGLCWWWNITVKIKHFPNLKEFLLTLSDSQLRYFIISFLHLLQANYLKRRFLLARILSATQTKLCKSISKESLCLSSVWNNVISSVSLNSETMQKRKPFKTKAWILSLFNVFFNLAAPSKSPPTSRRQEAISEDNFQKHHLRKSLDSFLFPVK